MRLEVVVRDIVGLTGASIIEIFLNLQNSGTVTAKIWNKRLQKLYNLMVIMITFLLCHRNGILDTDLQISQILKELIDKDENKKQHTIEKKAQTEKQKCSKPDGYEPHCLPIF